MIWKILIFADLILTLWCVYGVLEITQAVKGILMILDFRRTKEDKTE